MSTVEFQKCPVVYFHIHIARLYVTCRLSEKAI